MKSSFLSQFQYFLLVIVLSLFSQLVYSQAPTITSFSPTSGAVGSTVTITGTGFNTTLQDNVVYFGDVKATVTSATATQILVSVPSGTSGFSEITYVNLSNKRSCDAQRRFSTTFVNGGFSGDFSAGVAWASELSFSAPSNSYSSWANGIKTPNLYADFNNDNKPDYVHIGSSSTSVFPNTSTIGQVSFGTVVSITTGGNGLQIGDIDNDGFIDLVIFNNTTAFVYRNNSTNGGTISFASPISITIATAVNRLHLKDMNNDGLIDIIGSSGATISYLLNTTTGSSITFNTVSPVSITAPASISDFGLADLDNNNQIDIIALHSAGYSIKLNSAAFSSVVSSSNSANMMQVGDVNNDGFIDFAINFDPYSFKFFQNSGTNTFTEVVVNMTNSIGLARGIQLAEMSGNNLPDVIGCEFNSSRTYQIGNNTSTSSAISFPNCTKMFWGGSNFNLNVAVNDVDGDGRSDLTAFMSGSFVVNRNIIGIPTISSFTPTSGSQGTSITISGTYFTGATDVKINGVSATSFTVNSATSITAIIPLGTTGSVQVITPGGTATSASNFTYSPTIVRTGTLTAFTKCSGSVSAAQTFTVSGTNLTANLVVPAYTNLEYSLDGTTYSSTLSITPTSGTLATTTIYVRMTAASTSLTSGNISITSTGATSQTIAVSGTVNAVTAISAHPSTSAQSVCQGTALTALSVTASGTSLTYQWYSNTTASTTGSTLINGATSASYTPLSNTPSELFYYCIVTGSCGTVTSNISALRTVSATPVAGTAAAAATSLCSGNSTVLSLTGHTGTIQWQQSSTIGGTYTNISGATTASYTTPNLTATTFYRAVVSSGTCTAVTSNVITVSIINNQPFGNAMALNGSGKIQFANQAQSAVGANFTVEAWVNIPSAASNIQTILSNSAGIGQAGGFRFGINRWNTNNGFIVFEGGSSFLESSVGIAKNVWQHVAVVVNGSVISFYINGVLVSTATGSFPALTSTVLTLGAFSDNQYLFNGMMDEVRLWNVSKTQQEILASMYTALSGTESALVAYFNFNQGTPGGTNTGIANLIDNGPNAFTGSLSEITRTGTAENFVANTNAMAITGSVACVGSTVQLYHPQTGGSWSSATTSVATINSSGLANCLTAGTSVISYTYTYNGCQFTDTYTMTVNATPVAPTVANTSIAYCQNATATALTATAAASHTLRWYTVATGGTGSTTAITPVTTTAGTFMFYVAQVNASGCEGPRVAITVTVSPTSVAGTASGTATICSGTSTTLSLTGNTGTIQWQQSSTINGTYTNISGATSASYTTPALTSTTYYRAQISSGNCTAVTSTPVTITVNTVALPTATTNIMLCEGDTAAQLTATAASGHTLQWYTVATGGTASTTAPTPSTSSAGTTTYYVSQLNNSSNCESGRVAITVKVFALPAAPTAISTINYCQGATATALTATATTGYSLQWYTVATGGTASSTAPTPPTTSVGTTTYYVSQKENAGTFTITTNDNTTIPYGTNQGQTFQVPNNVILNSITMNIVFWYSASTLTLKIFNGIGGALVANANSVYNGIGSHNYNVAFSFANQNLQLNAGQTYYFELTSPQNFHVWAHSNNVYTGGSAVLNGAVTGGDLAFNLNSTLIVNPCESPRTSITVNVNENPTISGVQNMTVGGATLQLTGSGTPNGATPWTSSNTSVATISATGVVTAIGGGTTTITYTNSSGCSITATIRVIDCAQPFGNALAFGVGSTAGTADFVQVNSRIFPSQTVTNFTIETWIRPSASDILSGTTGTNWMAFLGYTGSSVRSPSLYITNNGVLHASWTEGPTLFGTPVSASSPTSLTANKWTHVALVKDGTTARLFVDGIQIFSGNCAATINVPDNFYWLGKVDNQFSGSLDEVRFWSTARSQAQIHATMNTELVGNEAGLLTYFDFNQGVAGGTNTSITTVTNKANNALNGTLNNFTRTGTSSNFVGNTTANIDITGAATICGNSTTQYSHQIAGGTWSVSNGATATISTSGLLTATTNENITVSYAYTLNGCSFTATRAVAINSPAAPVANTTVNVCQGTTATALTATALTGHTLQWYSAPTGGTASATAPIPSRTTVGQFIFYVSQRNNTTNCESSRTAITVNVNEVPTISGAQSMTVGGATLQLTGSGTPDATTPWTSSNPAAATVSSTGVVTAVGAGSTIVTYTVANGCTATAVISVVDCSQPFGNALQFDGVNDSFSTASNLSPLNITGNITLETWIKFDQVHADYVRIIGKGDNSNRTYGLWLGTNGKLLFQIWGSPGSGINLEANTVLQPGIWYHISATRNGNTSRIYINGIEDATSSTSVNPQTNTLPLTVGYGNMHTWLRGALDEVRVWNVARSLSQIQQGMYNALVGNETGLVAYYDFNQGIAGGDNSTINAALDRTTNVLHGTLTNFARTGTASNFVANTAANFAISGTANLCANSTAQYTHQVSGGTWSVTSGANATISATGLLTATVNEDITVSYTYVVNGCSFTATRAVSINTPDAPVATTTVNVCLGTTATALTATALSGHTLQWYTVASGGTASTTAPTPSRSTVGQSIFYVSQRNNTTNCESSRTAITVNVNANPTITGVQNMTLGGSTLQLTGSGTPDATTPWASSNTGVATISSIGEVIAVGGGTTTITYTNSNGCSATASISVLDCANLFGNALNFDGVNDHLVLDNTGSNTAFHFANATNYTLEAWVNRSSTSTNGVIISKQNGGVAGNYSLGISAAGVPYVSREASPWAVNATTSIPLNEWTHIAGVYDGSFLRIYINGVLNNSISASGNNNQTNISSIRVAIGCMYINSVPANFFNGSLDEVRVWNVARTAAQISQSYTSQLQGNEAGLVGYYNFNQGVASGDNSAINAATNTVSSVSNGVLTNFTKAGATSNFVGGPASSDIVGAATICGNTTTQYRHPVPGGTWSVSNGAAATVSATGLLTSLGAENVTLSYAYTFSGCSFTVTRAIAIVVPSITAQPSTAAQNVCINGVTASLSVTATGTGLTYQWYRNTTASNTGGTLISGATNSVYMPLNTLVGTTYYYCVVSNTCSSPMASAVSGAITIAPASVSGTITGSTSICSGATTTLTLSGSVGTIQWQRLDSSVWTNITGATSATYTTPALTQNTTYRAVVTSGVCSEASTGNYNIVVNPLATITAQPSTTAQNVCINGVTASLSVTATGSGLTYQWYRNTTASNTGGTLISGATNSVYMPLNTLVGTTYYYCVVSNTCSSPMASAVSGAITIAPASVSGTITGSTSICSGATTTLTLSGSVGTIQWQRLDSSVWTNITGATSATYTTPVLTQNTTYRAVVTSGVCTAVNTTNVNVVVNPLPVISGTTSVSVGESITLTSTTTPAISNAWVSSNTSVASITPNGLVSGLSIGTTTITYTNSNGCTATQIITVTAGTTLAPVLTSPLSNTTGATTLNFNYTLPEAPLAGSVRLIFTPVGGGAPIIWTMTNTTSAVFSYVVGTNPTTISNVASGAALGFTTYNVTLSYQDAFGNPPASVTNTNVQTLAPPNISFANTTYNGVINTAVSIATINIGGSMVTYSIAPTLPAGLSLNTATGLISGIPTGTLAITPYTVTATNAAGTDTATFNLFIDADTDGDGIGNTTDLDIDGDGTPNAQDTNPTNPCIGFNAANAGSAWQLADCDGDGTPNAQDTNPTNPCIGFNTATAGSAWQSADCDGDGIPNGLDICPNVVNTSVVTHPTSQGINICPSATAPTLTVVAEGQQLEYQWYINITNSNVGGTAITGAINPTYVPNNTLLGLRYYYVVVSGTCGTAISNVSGAINIQDVIAPTVLTQNVSVTLNPNGQATITAAQINNGSSDNCGIASITVSQTTFTCANIGANTVTLTVTDNNGNISTGTAIVTVIDSTLPTVITRPVTVQLNATGNATVTAAQVNNGSTDNCGIASVTVSPSTFTCANIGANTVTLTVTDVNGNISTRTAIVTVQDVILPVVVTQNVTANLDANGQAIITAAQINNGSTDNCSIASITVSPSTFTCANLGSNTVTLTVTDSSGNIATASAIVTVAINFAITGDNDLDGMPDNCDPDDDNDGILDVNDNCPFIANANQLDTDSDGIGNICDDDDDNDGVLDAYDNCPLVYNPDQNDRDNDGLGDVCDTIEINVSQAITPNGDGINDTWIIYNIENHPNHIIRLYNRWGNEVMYAKNYQNDWSGNFVNKSNELPSNSYYYQIDLDGNGTIEHEGWIYITQ